MSSTGCPSAASPGALSPQGHGWPVGTLSKQWMVLSSIKAVSAHPNQATVLSTNKTPSPAAHVSPHPYPPRACRYPIPTLHISVADLGLAAEEAEARAADIAAAVAVPLAQLLSRITETQETRGLANRALEVRPPSLLHLCTLARCVGCAGVCGVGLQLSWCPWRNCCHARSR